jgi:RNA polymerase sigma factor (sigma-70 family)
MMMKNNNVNNAKNVSRVLTREQQQLVEQHLDIAMAIRRKYAPLGRKKGLTMEDLQQEACLALCRAAADCPETDSETFSIRAGEWCRRGVQQAINQERESNVGIDMFCTQERMDATPAENETTDWERQEYEEECNMRVNRLIAKLDGRKRQVVSMVYGIGDKQMDFGQIAWRLHLSQQRIRQIYEKAIAAMKEAAGKAPTLAALAAVCIATGCTAHRELPVATAAAHDTIYQNTLHYDSVYLWHDRQIDRSRDTLYIREHNIEHHYRLLHDTLVKVRADTIPVVKTVTVTQHDRYTPWPTRLLAAIGLSALLLLVFRLGKRFS